VLGTPGCWVKISCRISSTFWGGEDGNDEEIKIMDKNEGMM